MDSVLALDKPRCRPIFIYTVLQSLRGHPVTVIKCTQHSLTNNVFERMPELEL